MLFRISKISTFESNSQPSLMTFCRSSSCSEYQRYQLLRAIHNTNADTFFFNVVVPNIKDINFWEQFTTMSINKPMMAKLFRISKISTFESNSQPKLRQLSKLHSCSEYQRYQLLRAIHNTVWYYSLLFSVVPNIKDINFWEQFTTSDEMPCILFRLFRISKISTFESNSQLIN